MAAPWPCDKFDRVNGFIQEVCQNVEDSHKLCKLICLDSRKLLQPWPQEILNPHTGQCKDSLDESSSSYKIGKVERIRQHGIMNENEVTFSEEEIQTLAKVDSILVKAHQARRHQAKLTKSAAKTTRKYLKSQNTDILDKHQKSCEVEEVVNTQNDDSIMHVPSHTSSSVNEDTEFMGEAAIISQSKLDSLLGQTGRPLKSTDTNSNVSKTKKNINMTASSKTTSLRTKDIVKVPRPSSAAKMLYKTSSSEIGKHSKMKKLPSSANSRYTQKNNEKQDQRRTDNQRSKSHSNERLTDNNMKRQGLAARSQSEERSNVRTSGREITCVDSKRSSDDVPSSASSSDRQCSVAGLVDKTERMYLTEDANGRNEHQEATEETVKPFKLKKDGSKLKVPVKFKKLHSSDEKLRKTLAATSNKLDDNYRTVNHFKMRLEAECSPDTPPQSLRDLEVKRQQVHEECNQLCLIARKLQQLAANITDTCTWQEIYRTKAMLHTITTRYNELQEEIHRMRKVEKTLLSNSKYNRRSPSDDHSLLSPVSSTTWLPSSKKTSTRNSSSSLSDHAEGASSASSSMLQYDKVKDLQRLVALQYQAQFVMWQMDFEKLIAEDILPILQDMDPTDKEFIPLFRTIYSLVCHDGQAYPSVVRDTIDDSDDRGSADHNG